MAKSTSRTAAQQVQPALRGLGELMAQYVDGDEGAFARLHERLSPRLMGVVRRRIADPEQAKDLVQAVFLKAHLARARFVVEEGKDPDRAVIVWYSAIARNASIDALRKIYRRRARAMQVGEDFTGERMERLASSTPTAEAQLIETHERKEAKAMVRQAVASLPDLQREVIELHKLQGLSMREISHRLDVREGTLRVRAHRAYKAFASRMRQLMPGLESAGFAS